MHGQQIPFKNFSATSTSNGNLIEWPITLFHQKKFLGRSAYTNSLVNADSFYANFTNTTFQKEPRYMYLTQIPSLTHTKKSWVYTLNLKKIQVPNLKKNKGLLNLKFF